VTAGAFEKLPRRSQSAAAELLDRHGNQTVRQNFVPDGTVLVTVIELPTKKLVDSDVQIPPGRLVVD
jgi:hypothetical protein